MALVDIIFPKSGVVRKVDLVDQNNIFFMSLGAVAIAAREMGYKTGSIVQVENRGDNGAIELNSLPGIKDKAGEKYRIISARVGGQIRYAIERYSLPKQGE